MQGKPRDYTSTEFCGDPFEVPECGPFIAVYDKGAGDFKYPDDVGLSIGEGTGYTWLYKLITRDDRKPSGT